MVKNIILDVGKVLVAWEPEDAMKQLGFDDKIVKAVADATVNTPVWLETDRGIWSDEQILQAFYEKAPEYKKEIDLFWNHLELAITQFSYTKEWISNRKKEGLHVYILSNYGDWTYQRTKDNALDFLLLTDGDIFSYSVRQVKPEVEIYETLLKKYQLRMFPQKLCLLFCQCMICIDDPYIKEPLSYIMKNRRRRKLIQ